MATDPVIGLDTLISGWREAFARFVRVEDDKNRDPDSERAFLPLFEALNWAVAIDDRARRDDDDWWQAHPKGEIVRAFRFARNRVHHQWAAALVGWHRHRYRGRLGEPEPPRAPLGIRGGHWGWRPDLPDPESPRFADPQGEKLYAAHLAHRPVAETLATLHSVFDQLN